MHVETEQHTNKETDRQKTDNHSARKQMWEGSKKILPSRQEDEKCKIKNIRKYNANIFCNS